MIDETIETQRLDVWLWHARLGKTRTISSQLIKDGFVHVNSSRILKASYAIKQQDIITLPHASRIRVIQIIGFSRQRVAAKNCMFLYKEILEK